MGGVADGVQAEEALEINSRPYAADAARDQRPASDTAPASASPPVWPNPRSTRSSANVSRIVSKCNGHHAARTCYCRPERVRSTGTLRPLFERWYPQDLPPMMRPNPLRRRRETPRFLMLSVLPGQAVHELLAWSSCVRALSPAHIRATIIERLTAALYAYHEVN